MVEIAGPAGWILCIYITLLVLLIFYVIARLYKPFEGLDTMDMGEVVGGTVGRVIVGCILIIFSTFILSMILREFGENMKVIALTVSPISFVQGLFLLGMVVGAYKGIEAIMRLHAIIVPIITVGMITIVVGVSPYIKFENLTPILGSGAYQIFGQGFFRIASFSALQILFFFFPFIKSYQEFKRIGYASILFTGFFMTLTTLVFAAVISYPASLEQLLPTYQMARMINVGRFFQRIESVFVLVWAAAAFLYLSVVFFVVLHIIRKTFKLEYYRPLIFPYGAVVLTISLLPQNIMSVIELEAVLFRTTAWVVTFGVIMVLLILARLMGKKGKKNMT